MKRDFEGCQKEFYNPGTQVIYKQYFYDGKLYYLNPRGICRSNEDGTDIELIVEMDLSECNYLLNMHTSCYPEIMVNSTGIYFHDGDKVRRYSFDGSLINELSLGLAGHIYIYKTKIFYLSYDLSYGEGGFCIDIETGEKRQFCKQAGEICCIYGTDKYAVIFAIYRNVAVHSGGWYLFDFESERYVCLNSDKYPPHLVLSHPEYFTSDEYIDNYQNNLDNIFRFDLTRDIMWVHENGTLKPKSLLNIASNINGIPERRIDIERYNRYIYFFNGEILFEDKGYEYSAYDSEGYEHSYAHCYHDYAACSAIHNNILYLQMDDAHASQFKFENGEVIKLRNCWFEEEPREKLFGLDAWDGSDL